MQKSAVDPAEHVEASSGSAVSARAGADLERSDVLDTAARLLKRPANSNDRRFLFPGIEVCTSPSVVCESECWVRQASDAHKLARW